MLEGKTGAESAGRRLRIAFVLPALALGGAEQVVRLLARHMLTRHEVLVVSTSDCGTMQSLFEEDGIPLVVLRNTRRFTRPVSWLLSLMRSVFQLRRVFVEFAPDIIDLHLLGPEIDTLLAARLTGIDNVVVTIHSVYPVFCGRSWGDRIRRLRLRLRTVARGGLRSSPCGRRLQCWPCCCLWSAPG